MDLEGCPWRAIRLPPRVPARCVSRSKHNSSSVRISPKCTAPSEREFSGILKFLLIVRYVQPIPGHVALSPVRCADRSAVLQSPRQPAALQRDQAHLARQREDDRNRPVNASSPTVDSGVSPQQLRAELEHDILRDPLAGGKRSNVQWLRHSNVDVQSAFRRQRHARKMGYHGFVSFRRPCSRSGRGSITERLNRQHITQWRIEGCSHPSQGVPATLCAELA